MAQGHDIMFTVPTPISKTTGTIKRGSKASNRIRYHYADKTNLCKVLTQ